jgi:hypothetical protein
MDKGIETLCIGMLACRPERLTKQLELELSEYRRVTRAITP